MADLLYAIKSCVGQGDEQLCRDQQRCTHAAAYAELCLETLHMQRLCLSRCMSHQRPIPHEYIIFSAACICIASRSTGRARQLAAALQRQLSMVGQSGR